MPDPYPRLTWRDYLAAALGLLVLAAVMFGLAALLLGGH